MKNTRLPFIITLLFSLWLGHPALAYEKTELTLPSGNNIQLTQYGEDSDTLMLWIPSEYGLSGEMVEVALNIADAGFDLWMLDLHASYMLPLGKTSIEKFSIEDLYQVMRTGKRKGYKHIILTAANRGAIPALKAGRLWQLKHPGSTDFPGFIFLHPHLIDGSVTMGEDAQYLPIARSVNKPVFILQPEYSTKYLRSDQVIKQLATAGAKVKLHALPGITAGFHARPKDELNTVDLAMRQDIGEKYQLAYQHLINSKQPTQAAQQASKHAAKRTPQKRQATLYRYRGKPQPPSLQLQDLYGKAFDLRDYQGKVVLVNFWASWCGPCVKEIPSLNRLQAKMQGTDFALLTVDVKEPAEKIQAFFSQLKLQHDFPVLLDSDGQASKNWKVYAYPSNFLLDKTGKIRFAYRGALEWDDDAVVKIIESLL